MQLQVVGTTARMESGGRTIDSTLGLLVATFTHAFRLLPMPPGAMYHHYLDHVRPGGQKAVAALSGTMRSVQVRGCGRLRAWRQGCVCVRRGDQPRRIRVGCVVT